MKHSSGAAQLRDWMHRRGFNQREAAAFLEWHESFLSKILSGLRRPGRANAVYLQEKTGIPVEAW